MKPKSGEISVRGGNPIPDNARIGSDGTAQDRGAMKARHKICRVLLFQENPFQLGWFRKAFSFKPVIKTPDLLKHLAVWQLQKVQQEIKKGSQWGDEKSLAHTRWNCKYHIVFAPKYRRQAFCMERSVGQ